MLKGGALLRAAAAQALASCPEQPVWRLPTSGSQLRDRLHSSW